MKETWQEMKERIERETEEIRAAQREAAKIFSQIRLPNEETDTIVVKFNYSRFSFKNHACFFKISPRKKNLPLGRDFNWSPQGLDELQKLILSGEIPPNDYERFKTEILSLKFDPW